MGIRLAVSFTAILGCVLLPRIACTQTVDASASLVDALDAGVAIGQAFSPLDVMGVSTIADEFENVIATSERIRFRLQFDSESKVAIWAVERKRNGIGGKKAEKVSYSSVIINDINATTWSGSYVPERHAFETFEKATHESFVPIPAYWALLKFPQFGNAELELQRITADAIALQANVSVKEKNDSVSFLMRTDRSEKAFDLWEWEFELPDYLPIRIKLKRAADVTPVTYYSQSTIWGRQGTRRVPLLIVAESLIVRKKKVGRVSHQRGKQFTDTELKWLAAGTKQRDGFAIPELSSILAIQRYLDPALGTNH